MKLHVFGNEEDTIAAYAGYIVEQAHSFIKKNGRFTLALSGGHSPKRVYELLASTDYRNEVKWDLVYFFFGDERYVPFDDPRNNALMLQHALFGPLGIPESQIFRVDTSLPPAKAAEDYWVKIRRFFSVEPIRFDLVLLGLGDNAHTASLFPHTDVLREKVPGVNAVFLEEENAFRISMTAPLINQAAQIAFLVFGDNKADAVRQVLREPLDVEKFPAQLIRADHWFLDKKAARLVI